MQHCKVVGIGHPRTGTGFTAKLLRSWGLDVGHETLRKDGIVAWQLIKSTGKYPFLKLPFRPSHDVLVYCVRNPRFSIPSIVYTENINRKSFLFRKKILGFKDRKNNPIETAIDSLVFFNQKAVSLNPIIFRIEQDRDKLFYKLSEHFNLDPSSYNEIYNQRKHGNFKNLIDQFGDVSMRYKTALNNFCDQYNYDRVFL